ncbi:MAG TPA: hypothetical protein DEO84_11605 [candidate division Zixibacteria bacterium]|jgi:hypothetical protein|nr:hypothetical protein [candidate division Zixibacteria bacterium]
MLDQEIKQALSDAERIMQRLYAEHPPKPRKPVLMIVEDDPLVAMGLENIFEEDYEVRLYGTARDALKAQFNRLVGG